MAKRIETPRANPAASGKRARTRAKLINAAAAIVGEKGFHATTLEEVAERVGMSRGAIYGNFRNREDLFLAVVKERWEPLVPKLKPGGTFREQMRAIGEAVIAAAPLRQTRAVGALSFQLYALTHPKLQARIARQNAQIYREMAAGLTQFIPVQDLPIPAEQFIRVIHALTDGLLFKRFLTPNLITDEVILSAFEMLAPKPAIVQASRRKRSNRKRSNEPKLVSAKQLSKSASESAITEE
jgi:AcrR family transcriptional regulator